MIACGRFVFLHLHRSGGTFVNECLLRFVPGAQLIGYHLPRSLIPAGMAALPVLGLVRNPWSYYVSWYSFQAAKRQPNALYRELSDGGRLGFKDTVRNMLNIGSDAAILDRLLDALPVAYGSRGANLPGFALAPIRDMFGGGDAPARIGRMESLREELPRMLESAGHAVDPAMRGFIDGATSRNASAHPPCMEPYDDELRELVAERDALLIESYGFKPGD
jgi:hypothetical protein